MQHCFIYTPTHYTFLHFFLLHIPLQVQQLLVAMNLGQYRARFASESIAGDILQELGHEDLENDLQIKSKIHRVRLMKIIEGYHSARSIMEGESPYAVL